MYFELAHKISFQLMHTVHCGRGISISDSTRRIHSRKIMEACVLVEREQDKIAKKLRLLSGSSAKKLQSLLEQVAMVKAKFEEGQSFVLVLIKAHLATSTITTPPYVQSSVERGSPP